MKENLVFWDRRECVRLCAQKLALDSLQVLNWFYKQARRKNTCEWMTIVTMQLTRSGQWHFSSPKCSSLSQVWVKMHQSPWQVHEKLDSSLSSSIPTLHNPGHTNLYHITQYIPWYRKISGHISIVEQKIYHHTTQPEFKFKAGLLSLKEEAMVL